MWGRGTTPIKLSATKAVTAASIGYLLKKGYSCHAEIGVLPWGRRRVDVAAVNLRRDIIIVEVKVSWSDFRNDKKWTEYLPFCTQFYFAFPHYLWDSHGDKILQHIKATDPCAGIFVLSPSGYAVVKRGAKKLKPVNSDKRDLITRLAWRGGTSRRTNHRVRVYIEDQ